MRIAGPPIAAGTIGSIDIAIGLGISETGSAGGYRDIANYPIWSAAIFRRLYGCTG
ncbi:hypothetical protein R83H12_01509 [Fibrobacteria bacterium R8-3-H12]